MYLQQQQSQLNIDGACLTSPEGFSTPQPSSTAEQMPLKTDSLISLLSSKGPQERSEKELRAVSELLKQQSYFASIARNPKMLLDISSWIQYRKVQPGGFVYKIGDSSECFYIVLTGEVQLSYSEKVEIDPVQPVPGESHSPLLRKMLTQPSTPSLEKPHRQIARSDLKKATKKLSFNQETAMAPAFSSPPPKPKFCMEERVVRVVGEGESFGDLGTAGRRGTNAIAKQSSHLLVVKRQYYSQISRAQLKSDSKVKFQFLAALPFFRLVNRYALESVLYFLEEQRVTYNSLVYKEDDPVRYAYILYQGEFKLYKKVACTKQPKQPGAEEPQPQTRQLRNPFRNACFKGLQVGEVLAHLQLLQGQGVHLESCVCKSQEGLVLRVDRGKFLKKVLSQEHNVQDLLQFVKTSYQAKLAELAQFVEKQQKDELYVRYLHTPSARARKVRTESASHVQKEERERYLRRLSSAHDNFFNKINETVSHRPNTRRISLNRAPKPTDLTSIEFSREQTSKQKERNTTEPSGLNSTSKLKEQSTMGHRSVQLNSKLMEQNSVVPSSVKDIVEMVRQEHNYQSLRKPQKDMRLFEFSISKVPLHIKKKYDFLFKMAK